MLGEPLLIFRARGSPRHQDEGTIGSGGRVTGQHRWGRTGWASRSHRGHAGRGDGTRFRATRGRWRAIPRRFPGTRKLDVQDRHPGRADSYGVEPRFDHIPFKEFVVFDLRGRDYVCRSARPLFYIVRRGAEPGTLDQGLKAVAIEQGVEIRFNERVESLPEGGIVAHGPRRADGIVVGQVFDTDAPNGAFGIVSNDIAPYGYAYLLVCNGRATLGACRSSR